MIGFRIRQAGYSGRALFTDDALSEIYRYTQGYPRRIAMLCPQAIKDFYKTNYPEVAKAKEAYVTAAGQAILDAYLRNVSPEMKLTWGTHPNHIGHQEGGCFRCHDGNHTSKDGKTIAGDCDTCHQILAQDEADPKILKELGTK